VIYVDRQQIPAQLPLTIDGVRTRYVFMDRFHVTRSYAAGFSSPHHCAPRSGLGSQGADALFTPRSLDLP
jgi:hypothetical protein